MNGAASDDVTWIQPGTDFHPHELLEGADVDPVVAVPHGRAVDLVADDERERLGGPGELGA